MKTDFRVGGSIHTRRFLKVLARWLLAYLLTMPRMARIIQRLVKVGQIVLCVTLWLHRANGNLAGLRRVTHLSDDDLIRVVTIKTGLSEYKQLWNFVFYLWLISQNLKIPSRRAEFPLNVPDVTSIVNFMLRLYCVTIFVFCIKSFSSLYHYYILRALMQIISNAYIRGGRYVPKSLI